MPGFQKSWSTKSPALKSIQKPKFEANITEPGKFVAVCPFSQARIAQFFGFPSALITGKSGLFGTFISSFAAWSWLAQHSAEIDPELYGQLVAMLPPEVKDHTPVAPSKLRVYNPMGGVYDGSNLLCGWDKDLLHDSDALKRELDEKEAAKKETADAEKAPGTFDELKSPEENMLRYSLVACSHTGDVVFSQQFDPQQPGDAAKVFVRRTMDACNRALPPSMQQFEAGTYAPLHTAVRNGAPLHKKRIYHKPPPMPVPRKKRTADDAEVKSNPAKKEKTASVGA